MKLINDLKTVMWIEMKYDIKDKAASVMVSENNFNKLF